MRRSIAKEMRGVKGIVKEILIRSETARADDSYLYALVCNRVNPAVMQMTFGDVLMHRKILGIPKHESVRRARQKVQEKYTSLRPGEEVIDARFESFKEVVEFSRE